MVVHLPGLFEEAEKNEKKARSCPRGAAPPRGRARSPRSRATRAPCVLPTAELTALPMWFLPMVVAGGWVVRLPRWPPARACWPCSHRKPERRQSVQGPQPLASGHSLSVAGELS